MCGACARTGKLDCVYETASPSRAPSMPQEPPGFSPSQTPNPPPQPPLHPQPVYHTPTSSQSQPLYPTPAPYPPQATFPSAPPQPRSTPSTNPYAAPQAGLAGQAMAGSPQESQYQSVYAHSQPQYAVAGHDVPREESPDPWFPRR